MLSQFTKEVPSHVTLADLDHPFEKDVYPVGRLDKDSEGLLLLTNDKALNERLLHPKNRKEKVYWAQVEGEPSDHQLKSLRRGVIIKVGKSQHPTLPAKVHLLVDPVVPDRQPPIRERKNKPTSWLEIILTEGKNRQVRKMCAKVDLPVLRLIRTRLDKYDIWDEGGEMMAPGKVIQLP